MTLLAQEYFQRSAAAYPDKIAVTCGEDEISYRDLDEFSNAFARVLASAGVQRGGYVPFFMPKSVQSIKSILSILKSDCAYVPIDVSSPQARLHSILESTAAKLVIVNSASAALFAELAPDVTAINIDTIDVIETTALAPANLDIDLAYVLFTSGSTGVPKGVMIPHRAIVDYIDWCVETFSITPNDNVANHAPLYFDNSTFDIYTAFAAGATLHLVPDELNAVIPRMVKWISEKEVSVFFCVPSVLTLLAISRRLKKDSFPKLREVIFAGEVVQVDALSQWMDLYPEKIYTNMYGPTEITVDCTLQRVLNPPDSAVPIGYARRNMELFVRTESGELLQSAGAEGELLVRGTSVAYGYLGDAEKTAAVFIQNPTHNDFPDRLYCTGDLVRLAEGGCFHFIGRADSQVKYLGHRIELGEIEAALVSLPPVVEGVIVFHNSAIAKDQAIGALVSTSQPISDKELKALLKEQLPSYMVPKRIALWSEEFPRTPNGKYDLKAIASKVFV